MPTDGRTRAKHYAEKINPLAVFLRYENLAEFMVERAAQVQVEQAEHDRLVGIVLDEHGLCGFDRIPYRNYSRHIRKCHKNYRGKTLTDELRYAFLDMVNRGYKAEVLKDIQGIVAREIESLTRQELARKERAEAEAQKTHRPIDSEQKAEEKAEQKAVETAQES